MQKRIIVDTGLGEVKFANRALAIDYVDRIGGKVYVIYWEGNKELDRYLVYPIYS